MNRKFRIAGVVLAASASLTFAQSITEPPEVIFTQANMHTLDPDRPRAEAMAVRQGIIVAVGSNDEITRLRGTDTKVISLHGRTVLPGLIDAHGHMAGLGSYGLGLLDLSLAADFDQLVQAVADKVATVKPGAWILGGRWDHESWPNKRLPSHERLSAVSPDNPVWLRRVDGHAGLANAAAMRIAGVSADTVAPTGGDILRGPTGEPTGIFVDNATSLIGRHAVGAATDTEALLLKAQQMCLAAGLTGVHDAGISPSEAEVYRRLEAEGKLKIHVYAMIAAGGALDYYTTHSPYIGKRFTLRACKIVADGAMGSRGAWMLEPYADRSVDDAGKPYVGLAVTDPKRIEEISRASLEAGFQVCTHAIGDRANHEVLNIYERVLPAATRAEKRFRIEHAQLVNPSDIPRFAELGVIPSMQPTHATTDMRWAEARVGKRRLAGAYAWARFLQTGSRIAGGSDFPVESHNPFFGLYAAITRMDQSGTPPGGWRPDQRMTRTEALRAFTIDAAYAAFEENRKGSLTPGKSADFIVIDRDIMTCELADIPQTRVYRTVIGGKTVFESE